MVGPFDLLGGVPILLIGCLSFWLINLRTILDESLPISNSTLGRFGLVALGRAPPKRMFRLQPTSQSTPSEFDLAAMAPGHSYALFPVRPDYQRRVLRPGLAL